MQGNLEEVFVSRFAVYLFTYPWMGTLVAVLQRFFVLQSGMEPWLFVYIVEPCVVVSPCGLLLCVPWFRYEMYTRLRSGRDA